MCCDSVISKMMMMMMCFPGTAVPSSLYWLRAQANKFRMDVEESAESRNTHTTVAQTHTNSASASLRRVNHLLQSNSPTWPDDARHKLGDCFMQAVTGHRHGAHAAMTDRSQLKHKKAAELKSDHIDTAKMQENTFPAFLELLLGESAAFLADNMWPDATENDADGMLSFQELYRFFQLLNHPSEEVHAAFCFDLYDKDDSGFISLREIAGMIGDCTPGGLIEQDLLQLSMITQRSPGKKNFYFDDYWTIKQDIGPVGYKGIIQTARERLGLNSAASG
jgi:Ca2+-binding EF-hand superfamily protein